MILARSAFRPARFVAAIVAVAALVAAAFALAAPPTPEMPSASLAAKTDIGLLKKLERGVPAEFFAVLRDQADLSGADALPTREAKGRFVFHRLKTVAESSQGDLRTWLASNRVPHRSFWITNAILVEGDVLTANVLAERDDVVRLVDNPQVRIAIPAPAPEAASLLKTTTAIEPGVARIRAPEVWSAGHIGQGIVVASADTGVSWTHPAVQSKYRGWNGTTASHDYNWHDAIHVLNPVCPANSTQPCDDDGHGTHTVGTMVGDDGSANRIGVAPGARWIGCRNMNDGVGSPATYTECFQFFLAPTTIAGTNPDPSKAPDVVNNSWGCPPSEGCTDVRVLDSVTRSLRSAGITIVSSAGNGGPGCSTIDDPIGMYAAAFTVGASDGNDNIASFSSRGPVTVDGSNRRKPDIMAPGVSVRSAIPGNAYGTFSGTSMASPHVAGAVALLLSGRPHLKGQPALIQSAFEWSALPRPSAICEPPATATVPNNAYGWGRVDVKSAFDLAAPTLDVDVSTTATRYDALTDGLVTLRHMFGVSGPQLIAGAQNSASRRTNPADISAYLTSLGTRLDVDGNGQIDALTDGLLILRYLFGLRGGQLSDGAVAIGATRPTAVMIEAWLQSLTP